MNQIWQWDVEIFRSIHLGLKREWLDPLVQILSDSGLAHAQLSALACVAFRRRVHWGWVIAFSLLVMGVGGWFEFKDYGKTFSFPLGYLLCLALFWAIPPMSSWGSLATSAVTGITRVLIVRPIARQRPSNFEFAQPMEPIFGATSFPSGHTTTSFALAVFLAWCLSSRGQDYRSLGTGIIAWALLVGLARIYVGVHFPTDVLAGAALGTAGGTLGFIIAQSRGLLDPLPQETGSLVEP
jgi:membrane-associated phospholipid phosphatase